MKISKNKNSLSAFEDNQLGKDSCGVGFLTRKDGKQAHELLSMGHEALCSVPHRGGMSSEGVGDGAGICVDLSIKFFSQLCGKQLVGGQFGVGNFFYPDDEDFHKEAHSTIEEALQVKGIQKLLVRDVPVNNEAIRPKAAQYQLAIKQWVFAAPEGVEEKAFDRVIHDTLLAIEAHAFTKEELAGFYPISMSARTQVLKGRLNSNELVPYFADLNEQDHEVHTLFFHTRFSTNTDPHPTMAQPFRFMAHNGELNTDKKNRLSEAAIARARNNTIIRPHGQSDSCRLDQTLQSRVIEDGLDLVTAVVSMMPPAWENDTTLSPRVRDMLAYFSLYEEKNDGPAALIFGDGQIVGARLDRLGLRPLRSIETEEYLAVMSEAGQITFDSEKVIRRGRIEAGGMLYYDHDLRRCYNSLEALERLASARDYTSLLQEAQIMIDAVPESEIDPKIAAGKYKGDLSRESRYVAYFHNQESFKFMMDPMLNNGLEKVSAMGYGNAITALSDQEGGIAKYFSQRFAQVTNPPLDSLREADGMTLRVALGSKPHSGVDGGKQIIVSSPILMMSDVLKIRSQEWAPCESFDLFYQHSSEKGGVSEEDMVNAVDDICDKVQQFVEKGGAIVVLSDRNVTKEKAPLPLILVVSAVNQRLIEEGLRFKASIIVESGQIASAHHIACVLGFGASAVYPLGVRMRAESLFPEDPKAAYLRFVKAAEKSLMKTMGKVGLCTVESYSGGEFFEPNFLNTKDPVFERYFPNMHSPVGGVGFSVIAQSAVAWHTRALTVEKESDIPILGLFKERVEGAGHSYGTTAVRGFVDMTEEAISFGEDDPETVDRIRLLTLKKMEDAFQINETSYVNTSFAALSEKQINDFKITPGYRKFSRDMALERSKRPVALRDVLAFPADISILRSTEDIRKEMMLFNRAGNNDFVVRGLEVEKKAEGIYLLSLTGPCKSEEGRMDAFAQTFVDRFGEDVVSQEVRGDMLEMKVQGWALDYVDRLRGAPQKVSLEEVQLASEITPCLASGAMSHGALVASAHEAVAHGTNMVGGMSNSGEGGEHQSRYGTIRSSRIKQFASGRFGVWAGYLADSNLEEIEIKIGQGAKPGEGGQLPGKKVTVEIASARGGTPGVELISPPPHHDTYSIEDLAQLIHDAKAARVKVVVKLVSSAGVGTIAVGVAKAGADVINIAGSTGGTGAAAVTSLKYTGRAAEIGVAEVHQALSVNGIRQKVVLRCSGAHQTGSDVVKSALLGADSFEFGTTALMTLKCVMAKNCNVKCPAGLTTNPEVFDGDPRALGQYLLNIAHEVREILAQLGFRHLDEARGRTDLLHLMDHSSSVGQLDLKKMLTPVETFRVDEPIYLERDFSVDDRLLIEMKKALFEDKKDELEIGEEIHLDNRNKSLGGQLAIDIERMLNHEMKTESFPAVLKDVHGGRRFLKPGSVKIKTHGSAGQSYAAFCNEGMVMKHTGTCNDGVGKCACGGEIMVLAPKAGKNAMEENVLIGNFALFGATGGRLFIEGQAGDRFAVRNSGATAVVEGVGDFCCEYMTNGAVLNLGGFSKGFGNGMSGGFAYQYDPEGIFQQFISKDSVISASIMENADTASVHSVAVETLLKWHVAATDSKKGRHLLENWEREKGNFYYVMPKALLQYQDADAILSSKSRKELLEELAIGLATQQVAKFKQAWRAGKPVLNGKAPSYGDVDTEETFELLNHWVVLSKAQALAMKRLGGGLPIESNEVSKAAKNLILTEDHALMSELLKYTKEAIGIYSDIELATMISNKRLIDFKESLRLRTAFSMDSPGTYGWILLQDRKNSEKIGKVPSYESLFAGKSLPALMAS